MACLFEEKKMFTFMWNIENASMCPQKTGQCLKSPTFVVDGLEKTTWCLAFYPRGELDDEYVSVFLERCGLEQNPEKISVGYNLLLESGFIQKMPSKPANNNEFEIGDAYGYPKCAERSILLDVSGDVLTVCCFMWIKYKNPDMSEVLEDKEKSTEPNLSLENTSDLDAVKEMLCATNKDLAAFKCRFAPVECCARTQIKVQHMSIVCSLAKFCKDEFYENKSYLPIMSAMNPPSFILTVEKKDDNEWVSIKIRMLADNNSQHFVVGKITAFSSEKSSILFQKSEHLFEAGDEDGYWNFPSFIPVATMSELSLHCELAISTREKELITYESNRSVVERKGEKLNIESFSCLGKNYGDLYKCPNLADVIITCEQQVFHVHKAILIAKSGVFKVLFEYKILVEIEDLAPDVLHQMITFMYTEHLEDLKKVNVFDLYPAAHKYQVEYLKRKCSSVLKSEMSVFDVCDTLTLAHECNDNDLFSAVQNFIQNNAKEVFESFGWLKLSESNVKLAFKISQSILEQKINI